VTPEALMNLGAQLNTAGATPMYHIVGVTPEGPTVETALQGKDHEIEVRIAHEDLINQLEDVSDQPGDIDFVMFGCPHLTIRQVTEIAKIVENKSLRTEMWI
jgi:predicted aconitase